MKDLRNTALLLAIVFLEIVWGGGAQMISASEVTGSICTGVNCPAEGTVIVSPSASPAAGTYTSSQSVSLTASGSSSIHYTTDGTTPTCSTGTTYSSAISVGSSVTIKAIACYPNSNSSSVASFAYTITTTVSYPPSGGGGLAVVSTPTPTPTPTPSATPIPTPTPTPTPTPVVYVFTRDLSLGMTGEDVRQLQMYLNSKGFTVSLSGAGSPGNETLYFGLATQSALARFQASVGISPASGYFGPVTRAYVNGHPVTPTPTPTITPTPTPTPTLTITPTPTATISPTPSASPVAYVFTRNLTLGMTGEDVRQLQMYLNSKGFTVSLSGAGSPGNETLYFGLATQAALAKFQASVGISPSVGYFGSITRAYVNSH